MPGMIDWKTCERCGSKFLDGTCHHCAYRSKRQVAIATSLPFAKMVDALLERREVRAKCYCDDQRHEADEKTIRFDSQLGCLVWNVDSPEPVPVRITPDIASASYVIEDA